MHWDSVILPIAKWKRWVHTFLKSTGMLGGREGILVKSWLAKALIYPWYINTEHNGGKNKINTFKLLSVVLKERCMRLLDIYAYCSMNKQYAERIQNEKKVYLSVDNMVMWLCRDNVSTVQRVEVNRSREGVSETVIWHSMSIYWTCKLSLGDNCLSTRVLIWRECKQPWQKSDSFCWFCFPLQLLSLEMELATWVCILLHTNALRERYKSICPLPSYGQIVRQTGFFKSLQDNHPREGKLNSNQLYPA